MEKKPAFEIKEDLIEIGYDVSSLHIMQDILSDYQDSLWYGGRVASINYKGAEITIAAYGDVICDLVDRKSGKSVAYVKDKSNSGSFYHEIVSKVKGDNELRDIVRGTHPKYTLDLDCGNWWEVIGEYEEEYYELGISESESIMDVIMETLDSLEDDYRFMAGKR